MFFRPEIFVQIKKKVSGLKDSQFIVDDTNRWAHLSTKTIIFVSIIPTTTKLFLWLRGQVSNHGAFIQNQEKKGYMIVMFSASTFEATKN